jgi:hypothetical protein
MAPEEQDRLRRALGKPMSSPSATAGVRSMEPEPPAWGSPPPQAQPAWGSPPPQAQPAWGSPQPQPSWGAPPPSSHHALAGSAAQPVGQGGFTVPGGPPPHSSVVALGPNESWDVTVQRLTVQGKMWRLPTQDELNTANTGLQDKRLVVEGFGEGTCIGFEKKSGMSLHSLHIIDFTPLPSGLQKVSLKKKTNSQTPWLISNLCIQCNKQPQYVHKGSPTPYCGRKCKTQAERNRSSHPQYAPPATPTQAWGAPAPAPVSAAAPHQALPVATAVPLGQPPATAPMTPLGKWLNSVHLSHLFAAFDSAGYDDLDLLKDEDVDPSDLVDEIITNDNAADKANLHRSLQQLRAPPPAAVDYGTMGQWLDKVKLGEYKDAMHKAGYDLETVQALDDEELKDLIEEVVPADKGGHRVKLKQAAKKLRKESAAATTPPTQTQGDSSGMAVSPSSSQPTTPIAVSPSAPGGGGDATADPQQLAMDMMLANQKQQMAMDMMLANQRAADQLQLQQQQDAQKAIDAAAAAAAATPATTAADTSSMAAPAPAPSPPPQGMCPYCHIVKGRAKQVHPGHPYCGRRCGTEAAAAGWRNGAPPAGPPAGPSTPPDAVLTPQLSPASLATMCCLCKQRPRFGGSLYCGKRHLGEATAAGYDDYGNAPDSPNHGVPPSDSNAPPAGLRRLDPNQPQGQGRDAFKFTQLSNQFVSKWKHPDGNGMKKPDKSHILDIFECIVGPGLKHGHDQYCRQLEAAGVRPHAHGGRGNAHQRWHGTGIKCSLGYGGTSTICDDTTCATCNIIRSGFDIKYCKTAGRYGIGLYASATSSKAHQYAAGMSWGIGGRDVQTQPQLMANNVNALIVCSVAVGKGHLESDAAWGGPKDPTTGRHIYMPWCSCGNAQRCSCTDDGSTPRRTVPPDGCHSVLAETGGATSVNFDEVAVYRNEAIIPRYLVVYKYDPPS